MRLAIAVIALALAGCANTSSVVVGKVRPPIAAEAVKVYLEPPAKYETIAMVESSSKGTFAVGDQGKMDAAINGLKQEAAKLGANGVLLQGAGSTTGAAFVQSYNFGGNTSTGMAFPTNHKTASGVAIFVPE